MSSKGEILCKMTLGVYRKPVIPEPKFMLFDKTDGISLQKHGITFKGLNRMTRKIIGRLQP